MVLFFSGLSFAGYIARRSMGFKRGYPIAGMLGGVVSSTNVTLSFARTSRNEIDAGMPLALGVVGVSAVMCLRVLVATAVLNSSVSLGGAVPEDCDSGFVGRRGCLRGVTRVVLVNRVLSIVAAVTAHASRPVPRSSSCPRVFPL
jgi:hypothetical protein